MNTGRYLKTTQDPGERVLLVAAVDSRTKRWQVIQSLDELASLTATAGGAVVESFMQVRRRFDPATLLGIGKAQELAGISRQLAIDLLIFDTELSAAQIRNLEAIVGVRIIDRTTLILDIFSKHARTREAKLQVELAQLEYRLPRLTGKGLEFSRLGGGIGTRGPGEKKLEVDRRRIKERIATLRRLAKKIEHSKEVQRKQRAEIPKIAVVGYTNAGKSSLVNALTRARLVTSDQLFSTLDSNTNVLFLPPRHRVLISDTVGFLRNLPHGLIASFHATLAEVLEADMLIHIVDAAAEDMEDKIVTVNRVLEEIHAETKPRMLVFNKVDRIFEEDLERCRRKYPGSIFVAATKSIGLDRLKEDLRRQFFETPATGTP